MDELAEVGTLIVAEMAEEPVIITTHEASGHELHWAAPGPEYTPQDRVAADNVFTTQRNDSALSVPAMLMLVGATVATLKSIAIDEQKSYEREEEELEPDEDEKAKAGKKAAK